jgi:DNA repair protein RecO (recombination protein O)
MDFTDTAIVLSRRRHGESDSILSVLTRDHGRHLGLVKGGAGRRQGPQLEIGNRLSVHWRARLSEQLGTFQVEMETAFAARLIDDPDRLAALSAAVAVIDATLPEREPHADVFADLADFIEALADGSMDWAMLHVRWELKLLADLGFGLNLSRCAVSGAKTGLAFVSPKTGRAVTREAAGPYAERLLKLPAFLLEGAGPASPTRTELRDALRLTGHFLMEHLLPPGPGGAMEKGLVARDRLLERVSAGASKG